MLIFLSLSLSLSLSFSISIVSMIKQKPFIAFGSFLTAQQYFFLLLSKLTSLTIYVDSSSHLQFLFISHLIFQVPSVLCSLEKCLLDDIKVEIERIYKREKSVRVCISIHFSVGVLINHRLSHSSIRFNISQLGAALCTLPRNTIIHNCGIALFISSQFKFSFTP
jgi:hypothetical protein